MQRKNYKKHASILKDFAFHIKVLKIWIDAKTMEWYQHYGNVYFLFNILCVHKHNRQMNVEDITIGEDTFTPLMQEHLQFLKQKGFLQTLVTKPKS